MENNAKQQKKTDIRKLVFTALMAALSIVLSEFPKFKLPIMPSFISLEFSDVPAMLAALTMGPVSSIFVCLIKNVFGCFSTSTACVGELSNFILGVCLTVPAGILSHKSQSFSRAVIGCASGAVLMALGSFVSNYFIVYPIYDATVFPMEEIIAKYKKILPDVDTLAECLWIFNTPFTFIKGVIAAVVSLILYRHLRPIFSSFYEKQ